jgi:hypothetical protein
MPLSRVQLGSCPGPNVQRFEPSMGSRSVLHNDRVVGGGAGTRPGVPIGMVRARGSVGPEPIPPPRVCQFYFYLVISLLRNMERIEWQLIGLLLMIAGLLVSLAVLLWLYG